MFDLYQSHWVEGPQQQLCIASAPGASAPIRVAMGCRWRGTERRLQGGEADRIYQAAIEAGMKPLTFLHSQAGVSFVQQLLGAGAGRG